jgi:hypothetical protein
VPPHVSSQGVVGHRNKERLSCPNHAACVVLMDTQAKVSSDVGVLNSDPTVYRSLVGALQFLTFTWPHISYAVQQVFLHKYELRELHLAIMKHILRYLQGTLDHCIIFHRAPKSDLVIYNDVD